MTGRARKAAFSKSEEAIIRDGFIEFKDTIEAPLSAKVTKRMKDNVWKELAERCNSVGVEDRTAAEVNKKFKNMKSALKEKIAAEKKSAKQTGGGMPLREVSEMEISCDHKQYF
jgi:hypothetical protein